MTNPKPVRMWDMQSASSITRQGDLLDYGWEPFAVIYIQGQYNPIVYFRRPVVTVTPEVGDE